MSQSLLRVFGIFSLLFCLLGTISLQAQVEPIGGPYTADASTVVLLHFDNDYTNESALTANGVPQGNSQFFPVSALPGLNQCLYLENDAITDSSYVTIADDDDLDLSGDWTMEAWFNVQTFGTDPNDHRFAPVVFWKPGFPTFDRGNYFMEMFGDVRWLSTGYAAVGDGYPSVQSPVNMINDQTWYHGTMIRDTSAHVVIQMIHNTSLNLVWHGWYEYDPATQGQPEITDRELHMGFNGGSGVQPSWLDGFMDELRICNVARDFAVPPVIIEIEGIPNQDPNTTTYPPVKAKVPDIGGSNVTNVTLNYNPGLTGWQQVAMTFEPASGKYIGDIPQQPAGTIVWYYVSADNADGQHSVFPQTAEDPNAPNYLSFAVEQPNSQTLGFEFEEGAFPVVDSSSYGHFANVLGLPQYVMDAPSGGGTYSMSFDEQSLDVLEVPTPLIGNSDEFTLDFWLNPTEAQTATFWTFIINKPAIGPGLWGENTFEIILNAFDDPAGKLTAGKWSSGEQTRITLDVPLQVGNWYRVLYEIRLAPPNTGFNYFLLFQINDANNQKLASDFAGFNVQPAQTIYPMRIGEADGRNEYYSGKIDRVRTYNYATGEITVDAPPIILNPPPLPNQPPSATSYTITADVSQGLGGPIANVELHYNIGSGWQTMTMTNTGGNTYSATLSQQPVHTVFYYYITAENADGFSSTYPVEATDPVNPAYLSFAVEELMSQTLALEFEEGSGDPGDSSPYANWVTVHGAPAYSTDAVEGTYSLSLEGDSSYIEIHTPIFANSDEWAVSFWMNANDLSGFWRFLVNKPSIVPPFWGENSFEIITGAFDDPNPKITAGLWRPGSNTRITLDPVLSTASWYQVIVEKHQGTTANYELWAQLKDINGNVLDTKNIEFNDPAQQSFFPLRIGKAGGDRPYYDGKFDAFRAYNYAFYGLTGIDDETPTELPLKFQLVQNYPNPFNPTTNILFTTPRAEDVTLTVYDVLGRKIRTLVDKNLKPGIHTVQWDGRDQYGNAISSGIYFYRLQARDFIQTKKMILMK